MSNLEFRNITPVDFPSICRICLIKGDLNRFEGYLSELFHHLTDIKVHPEDQLPGNICPTCTSKLQEISAFIDLSKLNDTGLRRVLNSEKHNDSQEYNEFHDENVMEDETSNEIKQEQSAATYDDGERDKTDSDDESYKLSENEDIDNKNKNSTYKSENFPCSQCNKSFVTKSKLKVHLASHSKEGQFECKECGKKFKFSQNLVRHDKAVHKNVKPFKCEVCDKEFTRESSRKEHTCSSSSSIDKKFECQICHKMMSTKMSLRSHMHLHSKLKSKEFQCQHCCKIFSKGSHLKDHVLVHTGEKPHECKECGKSFRQRGHLNYHMNTHPELSVTKDKTAASCFKKEYETYMAAEDGSIENENEETEGVARDDFIIKRENEIDETVQIASDTDELDMKDVPDYVDIEGSNMFDC
ncbi:hypothetical protein JTB14_015395 [Gonioctena quinquepunctata]|nr:hypothetical protein JTB14_015395 [Gonioctena quinquepunctata]